MIKIDLNADLGEGCGNDSEILKYVSSANIACGLHAGSPEIMTETVKLAMQNGVSLGAHPGYPDREGFGREKISLSFDNLVSILLYQIGALNSIVRAEGGKLSHVKAHGALYNSAAKDNEIARAIVYSARQIDADIKIFGPVGSAIETEASSLNMNFISEVFADRGYNSDGSLVPRSEPGAFIEDKKQCADRTLLMIKEGYVITVSGERVNIKADTVCLHGDNKKAIEFASYLYTKLKKNDVVITPAN